MRPWLPWFGLLLLLPAAVAQTSNQGSWVYYYPLSTELRDAHYLEGYLISDGGSPGIAWENGAPSAATVGTGAGPAEGVQAYAAWELHEWSGGAAGTALIPAIDFVSKPLEARLYLNATRMVQLNLFVKAGSAASTTPCENAGDPAGKAGTWTRYELSLEARVGDRVWGYVPMGASASAMPDDPVVPSGWCLWRARFHSELDVLEAGDILSLRVFVHQHALDETQLVVGLAGGTQSLLHIPFYAPYEFLARRPEFAGDTQQLGPGRGAVVNHMGFGLFVAAAAGGLCLSTRGGRRGMLAAAVVTSLLLAGCGAPGGGGGKDDAATPQLGGSQDVDVIHQAGLGGAGLAGTEAGNGSISATIHDPYNRAIANAHLSILDSDHYGTTDGFGGIAFPNVEPRRYEYRVDHDDFFTFEGSFVVEQDAVTVLDVELAFRDPKVGDALEHVHPDWPANGKDTLLDEDVRWNGGAYVDEDRLCQNPTTTETALNNPRYCFTEFVLPYDEQNPRTIHPGADRLTATVSWTESPEVNLKRIGFMFLANERGQSGNPSWNAMLPRTNGQTTSVAVTWEMTDAGHQTFSTWGLRLWIPLHASSDVTGLPHVRAITLPDVLRVKIEVERGVVPLERGHRDFWGTNDTLTLLEDEPQVYHWIPHGLVPPETSWLEIEVERSRKEQFGTDLTLWYKAADSPDHPLWRIDREMPAPTSSTGNTDTWHVKVPPAFVDPYYALSTGWRLRMNFPTGTSDADEQITAVEGRASGVVTFKMTLVAHRDAPPSDAVDVLAGT